MTFQHNVGYVEPKSHNKLDLFGCFDRTLTCNRHRAMGNTAVGKHCADKKLTAVALDQGCMPLNCKMQQCKNLYMHYGSL